MKDGPVLDKENVGHFYWFAVERHGSGSIHVCSAWWTFAKRS